MRHGNGQMFARRSLGDRDCQPAIQSDNVVVEQTKENPKPLEDVIVASEDDVPTWDQSADKTTLSSENAESDK